MFLSEKRCSWILSFKVSFPSKINVNKEKSNSCRAYDKRRYLKYLQPYEK